MYNICLQLGRPGFDPWLGKITWRRAWQPSPVFLPGESPWTEEPGGSSPWGRRVRHDWESKHLKRIVKYSKPALLLFFFFLIFYFILFFSIYFDLLEANYFTILQWFLPCIDMNQPWEILDWRILPCSHRLNDKLIMVCLLGFML